MTKQLILNVQNKLPGNVLSSIWSNVAYLIASTHNTNALQLSIYAFIVQALQNSNVSLSKSTFNVEDYRIGNTVQMPLELPKMHSMYIEDKRSKKRNKIKLFFYKLLLKIKLLK